MFILRATQRLYFLIFEISENKNPQFEIRFVYNKTWERPIDLEVSKFQKIHQ